MAQQVLLTQLRDSAFESTVLDGAGDGSVMFNGPSGNSAWLIERHHIDGPTIGQVTCFLYADAPENLRDFGDDWPRAIGDQSSPIYVPPGAPILYVFEGCDAAIEVVVSIQIRLLSTSPGVG